MTRMRASTLALAIGEAPVSGALLTPVAAAIGPMMTGGTAAGACEIRPDATSTLASSGGLHPSVTHENPTTTHATGHPYFISTLPRQQEPRSAKRKTAGDMPRLKARIWTGAATVPCAASRAPFPRRSIRRDQSVLSP